MGIQTVSSGNSLGGIFRGADTGVATGLTIVESVIRHPMNGVKDFFDAMRNFRIPTVPESEEYSIMTPFIKIYNTISNYHSTVINNSSLYSNHIEKKTYEWTKIIFFPLMLFKTTDVLRDSIAHKIAFAVRAIVLAVIQALGHSIPYISLSTLISAGMYIYTLNPLALTGIFTGTILVIQLFLIHALVHVVKPIPNVIAKTAKDMHNDLYIFSWASGILVKTEQMGVNLGAMVIRVIGTIGSTGIGAMGKVVKLFQN